MVKATPKGIILPPARLSAFAEGRMGQYRVPMRKQPPSHAAEVRIIKRDVAYRPIHPGLNVSGSGGWHGLGRCPYKPGDVLYVKEAFTYWEKPVEKDPAPREGESIEDWYKRNISSGEDFLVYKADGHKRSLSEWAHPHEIYEHCVGRFGKTIPASHMPAWAARHWLRVESVRAQRVQEITEAEAMAEGVDRIELSPGRDFGEVNGIPMRGHPMTSDYVWAYMQLWNSTHPSRPWEANDWCWALNIQPHNPEGVK